VLAGDQLVDPPALVETDLVDVVDDVLDAPVGGVLGEVLRQ
jgi:hypothetical protein